jgi:hypothetical protein
MTENRMIVGVSASFEEKNALFDWLKRYARHYDAHFAYWDEFAFTTALLPEYDALLILNTPHEKINARCDPGKIIALMMEPGIKTKHPWMFKHLEQYSTIYSPLAISAHTIPSHGFMGWYFQHELSWLEKLSLPEKTRHASCIVSGLKQLEGHRLRLNFVKKVKQELPQIDMFGKNTRYITDKMDGLLPYRYSIAIENSSLPFYFTEKINDCFLAYTVPLYYGCTNIGKFFPEKSFIFIDINQPGKTIEKIRNILENDDWQSRLDAVKEARELVLHKYQPLAGAAEALRNRPSSAKQQVELVPVRGATNVFRWLKEKFQSQ